jgi:hypothetical protein
MRLEDAEKLAGLTTVQNALLQITEWPCQDQQYDVTRHGFDVGLVNGSEGVRLSNVDIEMPHLVKGLIDMCRCAIESAGDILKFNSIRVDWNYTQRRLTKRGQRGLCAYLGIGKYSGGELQLGSEYFVTLDRLVIFDPSELHAHRYFRGNKIGITCSWHPDTHMADQTIIQHFPQTHVHRGVAEPMRISILSRDLGCFNTLVTTQHGQLELQYKRQGVWALKLEDDLSLSERHLLDTYNKGYEFQTKEWESTIYTVSDTASAASRPLPNTFYAQFLEKYNLQVPRIDYRTPFIILVSVKWGNAVVIGNRALPFYSSMYFYTNYMQICSSSPMHSTAQGVMFD